MGVQSELSDIDLSNEINRINGNQKKTMNFCNFKVFIALPLPEDIDPCATSPWQRTRFFYSFIEARISYRGNIDLQLV